MLSVFPIGGSGEAHLYYTKYCQDAGEAEGRWVGEAKKELGLPGTVTTDQMKALLAGFDGKEPPVVEKDKPKQELGNKLVKNAGRDDRRGGFDLTFSAPKSVSCVWAVAESDVRDQIEKAAEKAAMDALAYLQKHEGYSRTGAGGIEQIKAKLIGSLFLHSSNREGEPNLHHHLVLNNLGFCDDKEWRTLDGTGIFKSKMTAGNIYKASLANGLQAMGFGIKPTEDSFEIIGVSKDVRNKMSSRSKQIEKYLQEKYGITRAQASSKQLSTAALETRQSKDAVENRRDFDLWKAELQSLGFTAEKIAELKQTPDNSRFTQKQAERAISDAVTELTKTDSTFTQRQLHSAVAKQLIGKASIQQVSDIIDKVMTSPSVVKLGGEDEYTSIGVRDMERDLVRTLVKRQTERLHRVDQSSLDGLKVSYPTITKEQWKAIQEVCNSDSAVSMVRGYAGAGKSFTMGAAAEAFKDSGYNVYGLAPSNKAKIGLQESIKSDSFTLDSFAFRLGEKMLSLTKKDILIIDEAAMADSLKLRPIIREANKAGAKLVFLGDEAQLQPIGAGQLFKTLYDKIGGVELTEIYRQHKKSESEAILNVREGDVLKTLRFYSGRRGANLDELGTEKGYEKLLSLQKSSKRTSSYVPVLYSQKPDLTEQNLDYRGYLIDQKYISTKGIEINGREYSRGDQIYFTETQRDLGISKGETAKILSVNEDQIEIKSQSGQKVKFSPADFSSFTYGYVIPSDQFKEEQGLHIEKDIIKMRDKVMSDWADFTLKNRDKSSLIIASTNKSVDELNSRARDFATKNAIVKDSRIINLKNGNIVKFSKLGQPNPKILLGHSIEKKSEIVTSIANTLKSNNMQIGIGDKLVLNKTNRKIGYAKNDLATVAGFTDDGKMLLKTENREFIFDLKQDTALGYGYAITAYKSQGDTVDRTFVVVDSKFYNRNIFYVAISRSRLATQIYSSIDFLGSLMEKDAAYLKTLRPERAAGEFFRLYRQKLADVIQGTNIKTTSQDSTTTKQLEDRTKSERLTDAVRRLERAIKPIKDKAEAKLKLNRKKKKKRSKGIKLN